MATYMADEKTVSTRWLLINAEGKTLGRLVSRITAILQGKHKAEFTPHFNVGDFVVVINVDKIKVTGSKTQNKRYHHYSGYPGGLKTINFSDLQARKPRCIFELAMKGMLPKGPLGYRMYRKLKVYAGDQHLHQAQRPELVDL